MSVTQQVHSMDDLHTSINDVYTQYKVGKLTVDEARELMLTCSEEFTRHNNLKMFEALVGMGKLEVITIGGKNSV